MCHTIIMINLRDFGSAVAKANVGLGLNIGLYTLAER